MSTLAKDLETHRGEIHSLHNDRDMIQFIKNNYPQLTPHQEERLAVQMDQIIHKEEALTLQLSTTLKNHIESYEGIRGKEWASNTLSILLAMEEKYRRSEDNVHQEILMDQGIQLIRSMKNQVRDFDTIDEVIRDLEHQLQSFDDNTDYRDRPAALLTKTVIYYTENLDK